MSADDVQSEALARYGGDSAGMMAMRRTLLHHLGQSAGGRRDYYETFGWDKNPSVEDFYASYLRNPYTGAVVDIPANTAWRDAPEITDQQDTEAEAETTFETEITELIDETRVWHYGKRLDKLQGIGEYGVMVIAWADGLDLDQPVDRTALSQHDPADAISQLRPFSQLSVEDITYAGPDDPDGRKRGYPKTYDIDFSDEDDATNATVYEDDQVETVHHERVIHAAEGLLDDEIRGTPRPEKVWNTLTDLQKTAGAAAEIAYSIARPGLNLDVNSDANLSSEAEEKQQAELLRFVNDLQPFIRTQNTDVNRIAGEPVDPSAILDALIEQLAMDTGIPQKVLKGNETGEIAGAQDLLSFYGRVQELREQFLDPQIVREFIQRVIDFGVVSEPADGFDVEWPPLVPDDEGATAEIHQARSQVIKNIQTVAPQLTTAAVLEYIEEGTFPEVEEESPMEPGDVAELERRAQEAERQLDETTDPTENQQPPAVADGGTEDSE